MSFKLRNNYQTTLDKKRCYILWAKEGYSVYKIPKILASEGIVNPITGKNFTHQSVWKAANIYILSNLGEAKNDTVSYFSQHGQILDENDWGISMIKRAQYFLSRKQYTEWLKTNPEYKKYAK